MKQFLPFLAWNRVWLVIDMPTRDAATNTDTSLKLCSLAAVMKHKKYICTNVAQIHSNEGRSRCVCVYETMNANISVGIRDASTIVYTYVLMYVCMYGLTIVNLSMRTDRQRDI